MKRPTFVWWCSRTENVYKDISDCPDESHTECYLKCGKARWCTAKKYKLVEVRRGKG